MWRLIKDRHPFSTDALWLIKHFIRCRYAVVQRCSFMYPSNSWNHFQHVKWETVLAARSSSPDSVDFAQVMALIADFMLVWLSAPRLVPAGAAPVHRTGFSKFLASCPDNAFQVICWDGCWGRDSFSYG